MNTETTFRFIECRVDGRPYGLDMAWVQSIQRINRMRWAHADEDAVGWIEAHGADLPVYSLRERLPEISTHLNDSQRVVVLNGTDAAVLVDAISQVRTVPHERVFPLPPAAHGTPFAGVALTADDRPLLLIDPAGVLEMPLPAPHTFPFRPVDLALNRRPAQTQMLIFSLADAPPDEDRHLSFGLSVQQTQAVVERPTLWPVPGARAGLLGVMMWRHRPVPVIDPAQWWGWPTAVARGPQLPDRCRVLLAVTADGDAVGMPINPGVDVVVLPLDHRPCAPPPAVDAEAVLGSAAVGDEILSVLDLTAVARMAPSTEEQNRVEEMAAFFAP